MSSAVAAKAKSAGMGVTVLTRGKRKTPEGFENLVCNCRDYNHVIELLQGRQFDAVIDFLCYNEEQLKNSFGIYSKHSRQYFLISSCAVYNKEVSPICHEESPKVLSMWDYSIQKWKCEELLRSLSKDASCTYTIIRPSVTYGDTRLPYGISPAYGFHWTLAARALSGKPIVRWNEGKNRTNMTRVEDFAVGLVGLIGNPAAYNQAFNVCGDETPSWNDVLDALGEALGCQVKTIDIDAQFYGDELPSRKGELIGGRCFDGINANQKLKNAVPDFKQTVFLKEGVRKTVEAIKKQNYQQGIDWSFDAEHDRIIRKWCKQHSISTNGMNLHFIDYLGNATPQNRRLYQQTLHRDDAIYNIICRVFNLPGLRTVKKLFGK